MKCLCTGLVTALIVGSAIVPADAEEPYCKDRNCVDGVPANLPEQPHTHQEAVEPQEATDWVIIPMSPIIRAVRNGPEHKEWIDLHGTQGAQNVEEFTRMYLLNED